ncbi:toxin-antitoxin system YwqK family antitoxin [Cellulomonas pakistanensis]|uniref:MORN repeat variant n=1 Tax=Cellulomonas pakistanensis TaxID=992287 RepID=A0A919PBX9_9CELL|nr:hypothetical protein [Cellulomonas pakistanensis]GIG36856.1 hypothetical protein Cpa01nite_22370 [Cellulomonas pakistanensis]
MSPHPDAAPPAEHEPAPPPPAGPLPPADELPVHEERHRDGSLRARGPLLGDDPHGYWEWYRLDGSIMRSGSFDRGVQVGAWTTYDRAGRPYKVTQMDRPAAS